MKDVITTVAQVLALENGATLTVTAGVAADRSNPLLTRMAEVLSGRLAAVGIDLLALRLEGDCLVAHIDESGAEEPLCPNAFRRVVQELTYRLTGHVLDARLQDETPAPRLASAA